ncbi:MAG: hypothetical protein M1819_001318 [Sarea resinae]|nr:MAG: hypothetical protein M1819_001318 [Sarea resinae]
MKASTLNLVLLSLTNVLIPVALLVFAAGFFPYKPFLPGLAEYVDSGHGSPPAAQFDKIIFMVVDALRSDFVYSHASGFNFTHSLISGGTAVPFTAHATSPTITMPRIKAMTTGSVPSFLDVILNFAESDTTSTLAHQDTWLAQMKSRWEGALIMYGDDTWLKLFPDTFSRADGTSSFFVSDFTEVDNNVTRHVPDELRKADWNTMIMHYLGLDHIGHKSGPRSPNMIPKQIEMDRVVEQIYQALKQESALKSTLLVLCGDHGMNDAGNHGGSSDGETSPALVFISPKFKDIYSGVECPVKAKNDFQYYRTVEQSDIAPSLAGLLGFPVPRNNLGVFIPELLGFWEDDDKVRLVMDNALQILQIVKATFSSDLFDDEPSSNVADLACRWRELNILLQEVNEADQDLLSLILAFCKRAQEIMSSTASNYDLIKLQEGILVTALAVTCAFSISIRNLVRVKEDGLIFAALLFSYGALMFASSYVEEEQHFWYWAASGWVAYLFFRESRSSAKDSRRLGLSATGIIVALRLIRRWNQTGQKFSGEPDISMTFFVKHNLVMWLAVIATYFDIMQRISRRPLYGTAMEARTILSISVCLSAFVFKMVFTGVEAPELLTGIRHKIPPTFEQIPLVTQARTVFLAIGLFVAWTAFCELRRRSNKVNCFANGTRWILHDLLSLFLVTQSRVANIPLFLLFEFQLHLLGSLDLSETKITITTLLFQYLSFFALGGSNSISSVDLSNAYNGQLGWPNMVDIGEHSALG